MGGDGASVRRRVAALALSTVRRGRVVAWTPEFMRFGNHALAWFWAWRGSDRPGRRAVLRTPAMEPWLELFPAARALTVARADVRFTDQRIAPWRIPPDGDAPPFTPDWRPAQLEGFSREVLLSSARFERLVAGADVAEDDVVVNVRRGDYYTAAHVGTWGFDVAGFVRSAVEELTAQEPASRVVVVSDDPDWCSAHLQGLREHAPLVVAPTSDGPERNLATITAARRLVVSNSTFSYWGGYLGDVLHGEGRRVIAPEFFNSTQNGGRTWLVSPSWTVLPGFRLP